MATLEQYLAGNQWIFFLILFWMLPWKGVALWKAAHLRDRWWFIALLVVNTAAILEILYIFVFSNRARKHKPALPETGF